MKIKNAFLILICIAISVCTFSCTKSDANTAKTNENSVPFSMNIEEVTNKIKSELDDSEILEIGKDGILSLYGIESEDYTKFSCLATMNGVFPDEVIILLAKDEAAADRIEEKLQARLNDVLVQSKGYDAENYAMAQKCKVNRRENYLALFISAKNEKMQEIFNNAK